jgi:hypothetical protein
MNNTEQQIQDLSTRLEKLQSDFDVLSQLFYKNNFTSHQDFNKSCNFTTKLKIPSYTTLPTCEVGEICESAGVAYICSATNTWTIIGTQS